MKVAVIGGKLQGTEVTYLAKKADYYVGVFDRRTDAQAFGLADEEIVMDLLEEKEKAKQKLQEFDIIIPAMENIPVLQTVLELGKECNIPVAFDWDAYQISSSKTKSNELFQKLQLSMPGKYPECDYPVILKPDNQSGSAGVIKAYSKEEAETYRKELPPDTVVQEYLEGRSFSLEVIGNGKEYVFPQITEVIIDEKYDCKRIIAPASITEEEKEQLEYMGEKLAKALQIKGIFDIEVISHNGILKLLEIDARMPSQTPISVFHSCGINMVKLLVDGVMGKSFVKEELVEKKVVAYQQIVVNKESIQVLGEHVMGACGKLTQQQDFFGETEAITDYQPGKKEFSAIVITKAGTEMAAYDKFLACVKRIQEKIGNNLTFIEG